MSKSKGALEIINPRHSNDDLQDLKEKVHQNFNEQFSEPHLLAKYEVVGRNFDQYTPGESSSIQLLDIVQNRESANLEEQKYLRATYFGACTSDSGEVPISINSGRLVFTGQGNPINNHRLQALRDPMTEYQPIMKNLKNIILRNRNYLNSEKYIMPCLNSERITERGVGLTSSPNSPQSPQSPHRQQFNHKYIDHQVSSKDGQQSKGTTMKVLNMVYANKEERR